MHLEKYLLVIIFLFGLCHGHGYLSRPASRNYMRIVLDAGAPTECPYGANGCTVPDQDYDKQSGAAGGPGVVHATCPFGATGCVAPHGMCGDKFDAPQDHVEGGRFSSGLVNGVYRPGQVIYLDTHVTAHHLGYFEYTLYDVSDDATATTVTNTTTVPSYKLKQSQPQLSHTRCEYWNIDPTTQFCIPRPTGTPITATGYDYTTAWVLPAGVTCKRCVLQWHWVTGNSPGANPEEFWGCADITIRNSLPFINDNQVNAVSIDEGYSPSATTSTYTEVVGPYPATVTPANAAPATSGQGASNPAQSATTTGAQAPPVSAYTRQCVAVPGKGASDNWCATVKCDQVYLDGGYCRYADSVSATPITVAATVAPVATAAPVATVTAAPVGPVTAHQPATQATTAPTSTCRAVPGKGIPDVWCQQVQCDIQYVNGGFCTTN